MTPQPSATFAQEGTLRDTMRATLTTVFPAGERSNYVVKIGYEDYTHGYTEQVLGDYDTSVTFPCLALGIARAQVYTVPKDLSQTILVQGYKLIDGAVVTENSPV